MSDHGWTARHRLTSRLREIRPPGFAMEARHSDAQYWTTYRYTRLSDGRSLVMTVSDLACEMLGGLELLAKRVTAEVLWKFSASAGSQPSAEENP